MRFIRLPIGAAAVAVSFGAVACGPTPSPTPSAQAHTATPGPTATPTPSAPFTPPGTPTPVVTNGTYSVTVAVSGTDNVQGSFTQAVGASAHCSPPGQLSGTVSGQNITLQLSGAPPPVSVPVLSPGDMLLTLGTHTWGVASAANAPHGTTGSLQRDADGSGNAQFQNLALQSNFAQQPQESGSVTWTCA